VGHFGYSHQPLRWHSVRVVEQTILTLNSQGAPIALPTGTVLFGPIAESGDFAVMMQGSESYKCHIGELVRYTAEVVPEVSEAVVPREKVA